MCQMSNVSAIPPEPLLARFVAVRRHTCTLAAPLSEADLTIQAAEFASPGKWHLAHTSWFFESFLLNPLGVRHPHTDNYRFLFNSYYDSLGARQLQARRGLITRPGLGEVMAYREWVDDALARAWQAGLDEAQQGILELGIQHEQQHQELLLTDTLYHFAQNPLCPAYRPLPAATPAPAPGTAAAAVMREFAGGLHTLGHDSTGFSFDNERPAHPVFLQPFRLACHPVSNADWIAFIADGGYREPLLWLADGWKTVQQEHWQLPLYWQLADDGYRSMTLHGLQLVDPAAPVSHVSYYEAEAYARWAGMRLPSEAEWEVAAREVPLSGHFGAGGDLRPRPDNGSGLRQLYGDVWQWTASPYVAYPGFRAGAGALGEYNGKFMCGQFVLRGASCATPASHARLTYRNFFYPHQRWQFSGLRLAQDAD